MSIQGAEVESELRHHIYPSSNQAITDSQVKFYYRTQLVLAPAQALNRATITEPTATPTWR